MGPSTAIEAGNSLLVSEVRAREGGEAISSEVEDLKTLMGGEAISSEVGGLPPHRMGRIGLTVKH